MILITKQTQELNKERAPAGMAGVFVYSHKFSLDKISLYGNIDT